MTIRYVALGDSFTEGVGDPDPARPNGVRGWADRLAEFLAVGDPGLLYANLAIRGRKLRQVVDEQLEPALALEPTLVTIYAGGNDILRPSVDIDELLEHYDRAIGGLRAAGATVVVFTGFDTGRSKIFRGTRGRTAIYNELVREIADTHGALIADYWRFDEYNDMRMWDADRLHMSTLGHVSMATRVLDLLSEAPGPGPDALPPAVARRLAEVVRADAAWAVGHLTPWVGRRLTGRSSGDGLSPRFPQLVPVGGLTQ